MISSKYIQPKSPGEASAPNMQKPYLLPCLLSVSGICSLLPSFRCHCLASWQHLLLSDSLVATLPFLPSCSHPAPWSQGDLCDLSVWVCPCVSTSTCGYVHTVWLKVLSTLFKIEITKEGEWKKSFTFLSSLPFILQVCCLDSWCIYFLSFYIC